MIDVKKEYIIYHKNTEDKCWFFDEPYISKEEMVSRVDYLKRSAYEIKVKTRYTIEI